MSNGLKTILLVIAIVAVMTIACTGMFLNISKNTYQEKACVQAGKQWVAVNHHWWTLTNNHECIG